MKHIKKTNQSLINLQLNIKKDFEWLSEVDSLALCNVQMNLQRAYNNFFKNPNSKHPKFKSKKKNKNSYIVNNIVSKNKSGELNSIRLSDDSKFLRIGKCGFVRVVAHREIPPSHKVKAVTVSKSRRGQYFASILIEYERDAIEKNIVNLSQVVGLDFSMKDLYYSSEGEIANYPRYYRESLEKLAKEQKKLSRKKRGSNNRNKQRIKVAKIHDHVSNQRRDFLHKESRKLVNRFDAIIVETLDMKNMSQHLRLGKSVYDNSWGIFNSNLKYKLELEGKQFIKIDKWYPSSKTCSNCGCIKDDLKLSDRMYECKECGSSIDRDYNASLNIKRVGMTQLAW